MWTYSQTTGMLTHDGSFAGRGYSGTGKGRNNPDEQATHAIGPIPRGFYTIGKAYEHPKLGPVVMNLTPLSSTEEFGRSAFRIHGNNAKDDASHGCIILGHPVRVMIDDFKDRDLEVVA